jgi:hypothetical protein
MKDLLPIFQYPAKVSKETSKEETLENSNTQLKEEPILINLQEYQKMKKFKE